MIGLIVLLAAGGVLSIRPGIATWGVAQWAELSPPLRYAIIGLSVLVCLPAIARALDRMADHAARLPGITLVLIVAAVAAFVVFRVHNYAIGDGYLLLAYLRDWDLSGLMNLDTLLTSNTNDLALHWILGAGILLPLGFAWADTYVVVGAISGLFGLWGILRFSRFVHPNREIRLFVFFACLTAGSVYLWFGHVESYTVAFVAGLWSCVLATESMEDRRKLKFAWLTLVVAAMFHIISLCLLPMLVYVSLSPRYRDLLSRFGSPLALALAGFMVSGVGAWGTRMLGIKFLVPILPSGETTYAAFTSDHLFDMLNVLIRTAPLAAIALSVWWWGRTSGSARMRQIRTVLAFGAAGTWYFAFWLDPTLGALRDWDLLMLPAFPLSLWAATFLAGWRQPQRSPSPRWVVAAVLTLVNVGVLVAVNRDPATSAESMNKLLLEDVHLSGRYYSGARLVPWGTTLLNLDRPDLAVEHFRRRTVAVPDDVVAWRNLGWSHYELGDAIPACWALEAGLRIDSVNASMLSYLGLAKMMLGDWEGARDAFERKLAVRPWDVECLYGAGVASANTGQDSAASEYLTRAIGLLRDALKEYTRERVPLDWAMTQYNLGSALRIIGERNSDVNSMCDALACHLQSWEVFAAAGHTSASAAGSGVEMDIAVLRADFPAEAVEKCLSRHADLLEKFNQREPSTE